MGLVRAGLDGGDSETVRNYDDGIASREKERKNCLQVDYSLSRRILLGSLRKLQIDDYLMIFAMVRKTPAGRPSFPPPRTAAGKSPQRVPC